MPTVKFTRTVAGAHRIATDPGKCSNIHGHNYRVRVTITGHALDESGFVVPFDAVKEIIDSLDHALILDIADPLGPELVDLEPIVGKLRIHLVEGPPSTERLAQHLADEILAVLGEPDALSLPAGVTKIERQGIAFGNPAPRVRVRLRETPGIEAVAVAG